MNFALAFDLVVGHEGGYVSHPDDPGGETKYGISKRSYPYLDIKRLSKTDAKAIYRRDYWSECRCDDLPDGLKFMMFDAAVNQGVGRARRILQESIGAIVDGIIGPKTLQAAFEADMHRVLIEYAALRNMAYHKARFDNFGLGWSRRLFSVFARSIGEA